MKQRRKIKKNYKQLTENVKLMAIEEKYCVSPANTVKSRSTNISNNCSPQMKEEETSSLYYIVRWVFHMDMKNIRNLAIIDFQMVYGLRYACIVLLQSKRTINFPQWKREKTEKKIRWSKICERRDALTHTECWTGHSYFSSLFLSHLLLIFQWLFVCCRFNSVYLYSAFRIP